MRILYLLALVALAFPTQAQTPFWTEDFGNGLPSGWTSTDGSNQNAIWTWCSDPTAGNNQPGCSPVWGDNTNQQDPFQATTATNGFMTVDSDEYGNLAADHISRLTTSAIDCSGKSAVYVKMQSHLGTYTYNADENAILRVSTDQVNWSSYPIFNGLTTQVRWSANPEISIVNISDVAANQPVVYIQWQWTGNFEYMWDLDDIELFDENPTPKHDLALGDIFYPASSFATPASELRTDTFGFYAYVTNRGTDDQTNVKLKVAVTTAAGSLLYSDSTTIGALPSGYIDSLITLNGSYAPELPVGDYTITYSISADSTDLRQENNSKSTNFLATASSFAKEDGPEQYFRPATLTDPWYICNYYRMSKSSQEQYRALSVDFTHTSNDSEVAINEIEAAIYLLKVKDGIDDNLNNLDDSDFLASFDWVGIGEYIADETTVDDGSIKSSELLDLGSGEAGVELEQGGRYMAAIAYAGVNRFVFHAYNDDNKYFFTSTLHYGSSFFTFGPDVNAVLRLNLGLVSTTDERPLADQAMVVTPNPVTNRLNLNIQLNAVQPVTVTVADLSGKVIITQDFEQVQQEVLSFNLPKLAAGTYLARIATPEGTLTKKFVKL